MYLAFSLFRTAFRLLIGCFLLFSFSVAHSQACYVAGADTVSLSGELKEWHKITLDFDGPFARESCVPNPFFDYRLNVTFTHVATGKTFLVPGYFAADGNAAETSADSGNIWRCHFSPDELGTWTWVASFRQGAGVAIDPDSAAGAATDFDGLTGTFSVGPTDKLAPDLRAKGRLDYIGERYLRFAGSGEYFLKGGADAPENFLAYEDFDNTPNNGGFRKSWGPHIQDWNPGDPEWQGGKGHGIIGAINYLANEGMNVFSFLVMNIDGDDDNVFPFIAYNDIYTPQDDRLRYDVSKMDQWEIVFAHGERKGMYLHFKLCETENDQLLDGGYLGNERKLFFREMMARYGHHLALNWNMGEENDLWSELNDPNNLVLKSWMKYFRENDPYHHHLVAHSYPHQHDQMYLPLLGVDSAATGASIQTGWNQVHAHTKDWLDASEAAGINWVVCNDEQGGAYTGVPPYIGYPGYTPGNNDPDFGDIRSNTLWGNLMAGGGGVEYYFGYSLPQNDLECQDFRSRDGLWDYTKIALDFFQTYLPFQDMEEDDNLVTHGYCFKKDGEIYVWHRGNTNQQSSIQLPANQNYQLYWFDPRTGGALVPGPIVTGGGSWTSTNPPSAQGEDWVLYFVNTALVLPVELSYFQANQAEEGQVELTWNTAQELNSDRFEVERSANGSDFVKIGTVKAKGLSSEPTTYQYSDRGMPGGIVKYRLHMVDIDGTSQYSSIEEVLIQEPGWKFFPIPAHDHIMIGLPQSGFVEGVNVKLYAINGMLVKSWSIPASLAGEVQIDLAGVAPGEYLLEAYTSVSRQIQQIQIRK
ncbi:MAG: DUF5060 domain-containing protein [Bacteroidia bacterium]|nr:DUF5060 domain-containing protein [Bacteroidia bacterium]